MNTVRALAHNIAQKGGSGMDQPTPDPRLVDLLLRVCSPEEKEECLREVLRAAIESIRTNDLNMLCQVLLSWEYTCLWKSNPDALKRLEEQTAAIIKSSESGTDWQKVLANLNREG